MVKIRQDVSAELISSRDLDRELDQLADQACEILHKDLTNRGYGYGMEARRRCENHVKDKSRFHGAYYDVSVTLKELRKAIE